MANKSVTSWQYIVVMEFGKRHDNRRLPALTCYRLVVYAADLLWTSYGEVANLLRRNWYDGFWPLPITRQSIFLTLTTVLTLLIVNPTPINIQFNVLNYSHAKTLEKCPKYEKEKIKQTKLNKTSIGDN